MAVQLPPEILDIIEFLIVFAEQNPELVTAVLGSVVLSIYRKLKGDWPLLSSVRRTFLPVLHRVLFLPNDAYAARKITKEELVGKAEVTPHELNKIFRKAPNIFPNNFAAIKFREIPIEEFDSRQYEHSSWAFRQQGIAGDIQIHFMTFDNMNGTTDIYVHKELNPLVHPLQHYRGKDFDVGEGKEEIKPVLERVLGEKFVENIEQQEEE